MKIYLQHICFCVNNMNVLDIPLNWLESRQILLLDQKGQQRLTHHTTCPRSKQMFSSYYLYVDIVKIKKLTMSIFPTARLAALEVADRDLTESVIPTTYWGRKDDLDIEYSLIFQQNVNLMLGHSAVCDADSTLIQP